LTALPLTSSLVNSPRASWDQPKRPEATGRCRHPKLERCLAELPKSGAETSPPPVDRHPRLKHPAEGCCGQRNESGTTDGGLVGRHARARCGRCDLCLRAMRSCSLDPAASARDRPAVAPRRKYSCGFIRGDPHGSGVSAPQRCWPETASLVLIHLWVARRLARRIRGPSSHPPGSWRVRFPALPLGSSWNDSSATG